ncbi:methanethiol S-methyltransferase [Piscinibacter gummiphilus]|uniref:methanethiol S-methyltransferase n=1 Tax=Piscinibacter gummiphilus TaxID=946333 RepID=A0ABZ0CUG3_9BURK|nr:methanethiol S-methyltransferase [Piscinibacter gummiphilus]WOB08615.1 isoprenylcysteine carboxylmethyltransferase family protein [Piscinibacter gummiphilus]
MGLLIALYGVAAYAIFLATFVYAAAFTGNVFVAKSIDVGIPPSASGEPLGVSWLVDVLLLALFAVQHSVMARPAFKRWWTRLVPKPAERATFVLLASLALILLFAQWRPLGAVVWNVSSHAAGLVLSTAVFALGWLLVLASTFQIDHFELFGLKQVWWRLTGRREAVVQFRTPLFYRHVRHPIYLGFILAFWSTPVMTAGHLLFAVMTTGYILVGIWFEERDLVAQFGQRYRDYREQVGMLWPRLGLRVRGWVRP